MTFVAGLQREMHAVNPDMVVASSHWLYMALRRAGRENAAARVVVRITPEMEVIENQSYHRLLLMYKGALSANDVAPKDRDDAVQDATVLYGIANWHWYHGRKASARKMFEQIMVLPQWGAFGFLGSTTGIAWPPSWLVRSQSIS